MNRVATKVYVGASIASAALLVADTASASGYDPGAGTPTPVIPATGGSSTIQVVIAAAIAVAAGATLSGLARYRQRAET
jgi:hypothetical protein